MRLPNSVAFLIAFASLALASCGTVSGGRGGFRAVSDTPVKIGKPYTVKGVTYAPQAVAQYDATGYASWYGKEQSGNPTANGERFRPSGVSAAHKTLPLPSYLEVTALDTGRTILVRVNDRGPFVGTRIIDLSQGAAEQLGVVRKGVAAVHVRLVDPPESDKAKLRAGKPAVPRPPVPAAELVALRTRLAQESAVSASKGFADSRIVANERP
ncbi:septal ring lytic transglycosylase RlpA family protein [Sphingobium phenoxybenzoativorans]|uniref:septal ring lytic transglycosylase RlpA family protein n=1 Tax=Sphingobium phenoxybenzoativorans TaxID=1592790 RepID=UPI0008722DB8|nr:septal ring lytic transglycosylase RlpA family protein [Sphingobium phenoxybenzoativorans]